MHNEEPWGEKKGSAEGGQGGRQKRCGLHALSEDGRFFVQSDRGGGKKSEKKPGKWDHFRSHYDCPITRRIIRYKKEAS